MEGITIWHLKSGNFIEVESDSIEKLNDNSWRAKKRNGGKVEVFDDNIDYWEIFED